MLRLMTTYGTPLGHNQIEFSPRSLAILEVKRDSEGLMNDSRHDRVMELGGRCGDLLLANYPAEIAHGIAERLAEDIEPAERGEAFMLGVRNVLRSEVASEQVINAGANV